MKKERIYGLLLYGGKDGYHQDHQSYVASTLSLVSHYFTHTPLGKPVKLKGHEDYVPSILCTQRRKHRARFHVLHDWNCGGEPELKPRSHAPKE